MLFFILFFTHASAHIFSKKTLQDACPLWVTRDGLDLCLSRLQWHAWLYASDLRISYDPSRPSIFLWTKKNHPTQKKRRITRYYGKLSPGDRDLWEKGLHFFEWQRVHVERFFQPYDRLFLIRTLILHEQAPHHLHEIARLLGFVHLSAQTGIHAFILFYYLLWLIKAFFLSAKSWSRVGFFTAGCMWVFLIAWLWMLSGFRLGFLRPIEVFFFKGCVRLLGLQVSGLFLYGSAFLLDIVLNPFASWEERCLYFLAVGGAFFWKKSFSSTVVSHFYLSLTSFLWVAIFEIFEKKAISLLTPFINVCLYPVSILFFYPGIVLLLLFQMIGVRMPTKGLEVLLFFHEKIILQLLQWSFYKGNIWVLSPFDWIWSALFACGWMFFLFLIPSFFLRVGIRILFMLFLVCFCQFRLSRPLSRVLPNVQTVMALDVGQAEALLTQTVSGHWFLIDTGHFKSLRSAEWLELFWLHGITRLSGIYLTHLDEDHASGVRTIHKLIPVDHFWMDAAFLKAEKKKAEPFLLSSLPWTDQVLFPFKTCITRKRANGIMTGYVLPLVGGGCFVNLGDAGTKQEKSFLPWILSHACLFHILKVSHHGSFFSTEAFFLKSLKPVEAWMSVQKNSPYGHPHPRVLFDLHDAHIPVHRTDEEGKIIWESRLKKKFFLKKDPIH